VAAVALLTVTLFSAAAAAGALHNVAATIVAAASCKMELGYLAIGLNLSVGRSCNAQ
jgi:hypothetical protein